MQPVTRLKKPASCFFICMMVLSLCVGLLQGPAAVYGQTQFPWNTPEKGKIAPDPRGFIDAVKSSEALPSFTRFIQKDWPLTIGPYAWSDFKKTGGSRTRPVGNTGEVFMKKAYRLSLDVTTNNILHRKKKPTYQAVWEAYPSIRPTITSKGRHAGQKVVQRVVTASGSTYFPMTVEIYGFSSNRSKLLIQDDNFQYRVFFPANARPLQNAIGTGGIKIMSGTVNGDESVWFAAGRWAVSVRPQHRGGKIPEDVYRLAAQGLVNGAHGLAASKPAVKPEEPETPFPFELACEASGYTTATATVVSLFDPLSLEVSGIVLDDGGHPVPEAEVRLDAFDERVVTDDSGAYTLTVEFATGKAPAKLRQDFVVVKIPQALSVKITFPNDTVPRSDGRSVPAMLHVTNDGEPWAKKTMAMYPPQQFTVQKIPVWFIDRPFPAGLNTMITTDADGNAKVDLPTPLAKKIILEQSPQENPVDVLFPIQGEFGIEDVQTGQRAVTILRYGSPYPRILSLKLPGLWAGKWPSSRGRLTVTEPHCRVTLKAYGRFRVHALEMDKSVTIPLNQKKKLEFGFMPTLAAADDFSDIPDYGMELGKALTTAGLEIAVGELGGSMLNKYGTTKVDSQAALNRIQHATAKKSAWGASLQQAAASGAMGSSHASMVSGAAGTMRSRAGRIIASGVTGDTLAAASGAGLESVKATMGLQAMGQGGKTSLGRLNGQKNAIELTTTAYGLFEAGAGLTKWGGKAIEQSGRSLAAMKLIFAAAKATHDCYDEYQRVALGWEESTLTPFVVTVVNRQGFTIRSLRLASVKFEKKKD